MLIKKIKIIAGIVALLAIASCKKVLDREPEFLLPGSELNSVEDYEFALSGAYRSFHNVNYYGATSAASNAYVTLPDMLADGLEETDESLGNEENFSRWLYAEDDNQIEATWLAAYGIIANANIITSRIDAFASEDQGAVNRIKAQALAIRAMVHFDLLRYWADEYDRNSTSPGVPYIDVYDFEQKPSRPTVKEDYDHIVADMHTALALMDDMDHPINSGGSRAYIDADGIYGVMARVYLYANELDSAVKYSTLAINDIPLADINEFPDIWTDASNAEVLWSCVIEAGQATPGANAYFAPSNRSEYGPPFDLLLLYDDVNDIRFSSYYAVVLNNRGDPRFILSKYLAKSFQLNNPDGVTNFKALRTGEMYLIRAEAYARLGGVDEVLGLDDLNTLRAARINGYVPEVLTGTDLIDAIFLERVKELEAEGHRFFDLKRTTRTVNRPSCSSFCTLDPSDRSWTWPIPQPEIDANPNILPQNPGY